MQHTVRRSGGIVRLHVRDAKTAGDIRTALLDAANAAAPGDRRFLFHFPDAPPPLTRLEILALVEEGAALGFRHGDWTAVVGPPAEYRRFAETVGYNRGWQRTGFFRDLASAEVWLSELNT